MSSTHPLTRARAAIAAVITALLLGMLAGCSTPPATAADTPCQVGTSLTLAVAVHQGAQAPSVPAEWKCPIDKAIQSGVPINVVTAEGTPQVFLHGYRAMLSTSNPSATRDDLIAAENTVISAVRTAKATSDGDNVMATLALTSDVAAESGAGGQILVADPGLSDSGAVRFTDPGMTTASGDDIAANVAEHSQCPVAMKGATFTFYGLGYGTDPQPRLSVRQRNAVVTGWLAVVQACGGAATAQSEPRIGAGPSTTHTVKTVAAEPDPTMAPASTAPTAGATAGAGCQVELPDVTLGFLPESDHFVSEDSAQATINEAATAISGCQGHVQVTGTTSSAGTAAGRTAVSTSRATRVANLLAAALHVNVDTITVRGAGFDLDAGCVQDRVNQVLDPTLAQANRKTTITVSGS
jgi:outer membrane protein OmpA-like peptidoglycan-associated protein